MNVPQILVTREQAMREYKEYSDALKRNPSAEYLLDLKRAYGHMRRGHPVLDIWQAFKEQGLDANGDPRLAVSRADYAEVHLTKLIPEGRAIFQAIFSDRARWPHTSWRARSNGKLTDIREDDVTLPPGTFNYPLDPKGHLMRVHLVTKVPIIPARFIPPHGLSNYHILWEVEKWDISTPPRDPFLLKRISPNVFVVLAAWELTDLERAVLRGRIA
jgi:hypothetical protein